MAAVKDVYAYFAGEDRYPDLDASAAVEHLREAVRCRTVNDADHSKTDFREFDRLQALMRSAYPAVMRSGSFELIGHCVLITVPGSEPSLRPALYMSHQDVVPVVRGTEADWTHGPFSGDLAEGCIWGRGTLDIKQMVFGILEAAEYLLGHGRRFRRTAFLAFGDDEETLNLGALSIAETLKARGVELEYVLDEGFGSVEDGAVFGAPGIPVTKIELMEKGYADLELSVESAGGHSSRPWGGSSLEHLARAVTAIADRPFAPHCPEPLLRTFETLAPCITEEPLRSLVQDVRGNADALAAFCMTRPELFPFVCTTVAPTVIEGGSDACNVLPQNMRAVINFRLNAGDSAEMLLRRCREASCRRTTPRGSPGRTASDTGRCRRRSKSFTPRFWPCPPSPRARPMRGAMNRSAIPACAAALLWSTGSWRARASTVQTSGSLSARTCRASAC